MKKILGFALITLTLMACGDDKPAIPADCQTYIDAVEKLADKSPELGKQFKDAVAASTAQWEKLTGAQAEAANAGCKQMLEAIKPML